MTGTMSHLIASGLPEKNKYKTKDTQKEKRLIAHRDILTPVQISTFLHRETDNAGFAELNVLRNGESLMFFAGLLAFLLGDSAVLNLLRR
jgi:hypothetical protein